MKLYFLNPNSWGSHWTTVANSPEEALEKMKAEIKKVWGNSFEWNEWFKDATVDNLPCEYTLDEHPLDYVIEGEYS